jgi:ABC-type branched-subunit amino acid transport system substrate-binding protein
MHFEHLAQWVRATRPDAVMAHFSGDEAARFLQAWHEQGLAGQVPLLGGQFMASANPALATGSLRVAAWDASMETTVNQHFVSAWQTATGKAPSHFAALGYEAGLAALAAGVHTGSAAQGFTELRYEGLRGSTHYHPTAHETLADALVQRMDVNGQPQTVATLPALEPDTRFWSALREQARSGWMQPYLAI